ncbi:MarR family winged helix-turn-helix transcriptional regulator [Streptococcus agalactiae]
MENPLQKARILVNQLEKYLDRYAKEYDVEHLAGPQGHLVMHLYKHPDKDMSIKDAEEILHISKYVASNLVKRMEKNGFIAIVPSKTDKRVKYLYLTHLGKQKATQFEIFLEKLHSTMLAGITKEEIRTTKKVIRTLAKNMAMEDFD